MRVTVVYCPPDAELVLETEVPEGATVAQAVAASGLLERRPELGKAPLDLGVWNRVAKPDEPAREGDRIEVYRPLLLDPKEARRLRAEGKRRPR